ncbi:MAG: RNA polymerase sigma factor [Ginsengibacter sp.]
MEERELIKQLKQRDRDAFKSLVDTWQNMVFNTAIGLLQNEEDAEDTAQEVFIQVFESIDTFKEESKLSTWIYRITVSKAMDHIRRKKTKKRFSFLMSLFKEDGQVMIEPPDFLHPGVKLENKENAKALFKALDKLPPNQKTAFVLNKMEGLSYQETSEIMEISNSATDSLLQRARQNLKKELRNQFESIND